MMPSFRALQHDAQMDFYGKRLATCSSDRTVKVFDVVDPSAVEPKYQLVDTLRGLVLARPFFIASILT
jgi:hypothetical protein